MKSMSKSFPNLINLKNDFIGNREIEYIKSKVQNKREEVDSNFSITGYANRTIKLKSMVKIVDRLETINKVVKKEYA